MIAICYYLFKGIIPRKYTLVTVHTGFTTFEIEIALLVFSPMFWKFDILLKLFETVIYSANRCESLK